MSNPSRSAVAASPVGVVVVRRGDTSDVDLGRLLAHLARIGVASPCVTLVDPRRPADETIEAGPGIWLLGAANCADRAAAVAVGTEWLRSHGSARLLLVVGPAPVLDGALALLDDYAFETARVSGLRVVSRTSDGATIWSIEAAPEAGGDATAVGELDALVARWLREQAIQPGSIPVPVLLALRPPAGESVSVEREARFWIDQVVHPPEVRHGEHFRVEARGWVLSNPMPRQVALYAGGIELVRGEVGVRRPDLAGSYPDLDDLACGFQLFGSVAGLPVGVHQVIWRAEGTGLEQLVGRIVVRPEHQVGVDQVLVPAGVSERGRVPVLVFAHVDATRRLLSVAVRAAGQPLEVRRRSVPATVARDPRRTEIVASGRIDARELDRAGGLEVEVRSTTLRDVVRRREQFPIERRRDGGPVAIEVRRFGPFDPRVGTTPVELRGVLFGARPGERVRLRGWVGPGFESELVPLDLVDESFGAARFSIEGESPPPEGTAGIRWELRRVAAPDTGTALAIWEEPADRRRHAVRAAPPRIEAARAGGRMRRVVLEGELEGAERVSSLALAVDGVVRTRLGGEWLIPAEPSAGAAARFHRFRFDGEIPLDAGTRRFEILVRRRFRESAVWASDVEVLEEERGIPARLRSTDLDRLLAQPEPAVHSRLAVDGEVVGELAPGASVRLIVDGAPVAASPIDAEGSFRVSARPAPGTTVEGALEVVAAGAVVERSPVFRARVRPLAIPEEVARGFRELLPRLLPMGEEALGADAGEILLRLHERDPGSSGRLRRAIAELERRARDAERLPGEVIESIEAPARRLRVLFAAWEVPCDRHGGGVCMVNLLRHLGARHDVTLIHAEAPGEEGLSETVRPFVREIRTGRREWHAPSCETEYGTPRGLAWSQSPRLRRAIEAELASGDYDLVNYEYTEMCDHVATADVPATGALYELHSFGRLAAAPARFDDPEAAAAWLGETIATLAWETGTVATRFPELVVLTRPEAELFARWLPGRRIWVSPIPVALPPPREPASMAGPPVFVFVGNFIHPPNREAAELVMREIAPRVLEARPDARFVIAGPDPPVALTSLARPGVVDVPGFVADLDGLLADARAFVAPIRSGGGMRVKVLDAMARGAAVVTTALGSNGIGAAPGREILLAESSEETVAALVALAAEPERARAVGEAARARIAASYGVEAMGDRRDRIWRALTAAPR